MDKSYSRRLALNSAISKNVYHRLPVDDVGHENYVPVGRGVQSSPVCGKWLGISRCKNIEGHEGLLLMVRMLRANLLFGIGICGVNGLFARFALFVVGL